MDKRTSHNAGGRMAAWGQGNVDYVTVDQSVSFRDDKWEAPRVRWAAGGDGSLAFAQEFHAALGEAVELASEWNKDTGKE